MQTLLDGNPVSPTAALERALRYGDGLFETMRLEGGEIALLPWHLQRLESSSQRLGLTFDLDLISHDLRQITEAASHGVIRLSLIRAGSRRGYRPEPDAVTHRWLEFSGSLPAWGDRCSAILCSTPLGSSPALGGMKHLNRLEQVLGAAEVAQSEADTGLMCLAGDPVCGVDANLIVEYRGQLLTPYIRYAGVAGVFRRYMMDSLCAKLDLTLMEQPVTRAVLFEADALYLSNSVRGLRQVNQLLAEGEWLRFGCGELMPQVVAAARQELSVAGA